MSFTGDLDVVVIGVILKCIVSYVVYSYAAFSDWIKREINPLVWIPPIVFGIAINVTSIKNIGNHIKIVYTSFVELHLYLSIVLSILMILLLSVLSFVLGLIGGADVLCTIAFISMYPSNIELLVLAQNLNYLSNSDTLLLILFLPPIVIIFILYSLIVFTYMIYNVVYNIIHVKELKKHQITLRKMLHYILFGKIVKVENLQAKRFYYPIYIPNVLERLTFNVEEDDTYWINVLKKLSPDTTIVVTWGIPMVTLISIAIFLYVTCHLALLII
ncbi:MAG: hypothetical protein QXM83_01880 [Ignisphaera sp.]